MTLPTVTGYEVTWTNTRRAWKTHYSSMQDAMRAARILVRIKRTNIKVWRTFDNSAQILIFDSEAVANKSRP